MDLSRHLCVMLHCPFLWVPLYICVLHCSKSKRGISSVALLAVEFGCLAHSHCQSEALDKIEKLSLRLLAVWWYGWGCDNPGTLPESPTTELMSLDTLASSLSVSTFSSDISLGFSNCGLLLGPLVLHQHSHWLRNADLEETSSLCNTTLWM